MSGAACKIASSQDISATAEQLKDASIRLKKMGSRH
jgi:hypothetical protein